MLPYFSIFIITFWESKLILLAVASIIRLFAWCATNQSILSLSNLFRSNILSAAAFPFLMVKLALEIDFAGVMMLYANPKNGINAEGGIVFLLKLTILRTKLRHRKP